MGEPDGRGLEWGGGALTIAGVLTTIVAPLLVDALGSAGLSTSEVGSHLTALHLTQVVVIFGLGGTGLVGRFDRRVVGLVGCGVSAVALVACAVSTSGTGLMLLMVLVGAGAGLAYSAGASALSYVTDTERAYALVTIASIGIGGIVLAGTALVPLDQTQAGIFLGLAVVLLMLGVVGLRIPPLAHPGSASSQAHDSWLGGVGVALIVGYFLLNVGILAVWTYSGSIAQAAGMSASGSWWFLGLSQVLSVVGCLIAWRMGPHPGKLWILVASLAGIMVGKLMIGTALLVPYAVGILLTNLTFYTAIPFIFAAAADLNPRSGRLVVVVGASAMAAGAVAPVFGGWAAGDSDNWLRLGIAAAVVILVSIPLVMFAERVAYRRKHPAVPDTAVTAPGR